MQHTEPMLRANALKNKTILVTGGGTGLGKSMATYFSELGATLIITSRRQAVLDATVAEITAKTGHKVYGFSADVREINAVEKVLEDALKVVERIDVLVNNAAGNFVSPTENLSANAFSSVVDIVLKGTFNWTSTLGNYWIKNKIPGTVLNIATTYAMTGSAFVVPSACAKAGVVAMTRSLAVEWAKYKIRFNAVAPGPFPTKGAWDRLLPGDLAEKFDPKNKVPVGRNGVHQELSNICAYLVSDFSAYVNGEVITIDGGEWLKGAGQMNALEAVTPEMWSALAQARKSSK